MSRVETYAEFLGITTACLAIVMLVVRAVPKWRANREFLGLIDVATAIAAILAVILALIDDGIVFTVQALGLGFAVAVAIVVAAWFRWKFSRRSEKKAPPSA